MTEAIVTQIQEKAIYIDADGWVPFQEAPNIMPCAGGVFIAFGLVNLYQKNTWVGCLECVVGIGLLIGSLFLQK